ncbi:MAG: DNA-binding transcriptional regulator [Phycisphaerae bacterium]|nr:DNA-binding transcriptional regulator [Phycisphaerae bacterium]
MAIPKVSLIIDTNRQSDRDFLKGITRYSVNNGPWEFVFNPQKYLSISPDWQSHKTSDGFIVRGFENLAQVKKFRKPIIVSGIKKETNKNITTVITDSETIGIMGAEYLKSLGLKNFAFCGFTKIEWSRLRQKSFADYFSRTNFMCYKHNLESKGKLTAWLEKLPRPIGIMACNDDCAMQILESAKSLDIKIPEQIAILGVDNDELVCSLTGPPLSSIDINFEKSGYEAAMLLADMMQNNQQVITEIKVEPIAVIERESTNILSIQNETIAEALRYIRDNYKTDIGVNDVARSLELSRRALEKQFSKHLGRTIYSEIRSQRINHIARLLIETNLTVSEIMGTLQYSSPEHIARQFSCEKGLSPIKFRKQHSRISY